MADNIILRKFNNSDIPAIAEFRSKFPLSPLVKVETPDYHKWKFLMNPVMEGIIWLAEDTHRIVATFSITPKRMNIHHKEIISIEICDAFTLPDYQRKGIFDSLVRNMAREVLHTEIDFAYGLPITDLLPVYTRKLDYGQVLAPELCYLGKPVNFKKILKNKFKNRFIAGILTPPFKIAFGAVFKLATIGIGSNISVSEVEEFPEDIDQLWEQVSPPYDIMVKRDKNYLDWRYTASPNSYLKYIARDTKGAILGYLVARISRTDNGIEGFIPDFLTLEDDSRVFKKLIITAFSAFKENEVDIVSAWSMKGSFYYKRLTRLGFLPWTKIPLICYKNELGNQILNKPFKWHFTQGDSDGI